ncbi:hypothetical protein [Streptomyces sp. I05A-00742]|uniref:hypothetical protein n=1 Tax=Streptomyces sp. I05A-00742 TaxID=2732853 RepID=UPI0014887C5B|nr:hypothetical protein [Streptomyces sp. I05A-00742]
MADAHRRGYREGYESGSERAASSSRFRVEQLERRVKELEQKLDEAVRVYEMDGDQVVGVDGYAYRWRGDEPLAVGDRVLLPENYVSSMKYGRGPFPGVVTELGTTYRGPLSFIIRRAPADDV